MHCESLRLQAFRASFTLLKVYLSFLRKSATMEKESSVVGNQQSDAKRKKAEQHGQGVVDKTRQDIGKLIELDVSSDEEL